VSRRLGLPRLHYRRIDSTNRRARELAAAGAPHGTLVTASEQTAGRGRQGRTWTAAPGRALLCSVVVRDPPRLLPLAAGVAVAETVESVGDGRALVKWPNDVLVDGRKVAGILVEGRPQEGWAVVGIGLNVALRVDDFPPELQETAATLGLPEEAVEPSLTEMLARLGTWIAADPDAVLSAIRARDALLDQPVRWAGGSGRGGGIDGDGRLVVVTDGGRVELDAGEVHLGGGG
jgi:BirA family transcriptional regulator, biotin operon repressor / biotin---[acetyl-CoA-carboxylase] ligase